MSNNGHDVAASLVGLVFMLALLYLFVVSLVIMIALVALLIIGWYLTHLLFRWLNAVSEGQLLSEHGGLMLLVSGVLWAVVFWLVVPHTWVVAAMDGWPWLANVPYFVPVIGATLGLTWSMIVLYIAEHESDVTPLDITGMYSLSETDVFGEDEGAVELLTDSVVLGTDV